MQSPGYARENIFAILMVDKECFLTVSRYTSTINFLDKGRPSAGATDRRSKERSQRRPRLKCYNVILTFYFRKFHFSPEGSLIVFNASYPDAGAYECVADNGRQGGRKTARKDN